VGSKLDVRRAGTGQDRRESVLPVQRKEEEIMSNIVLPQPLDQWTPWASEIQNLSMHIIRWVVDGVMAPPLTVLGMDNNGKFLFSFVADQNMLAVGLIAPPAHPLVVKIIDSKASEKILHFP
jgi:hypothetical protein